ncbi:MerR family transcriptional regulator [Rhizobium sp. SG741]|uniref:MerR family transcriptional regulator n=1 Tax=Rhizobium sp. SG741 TaxID=2587114 RepID=UPI0014478218|nr:MerR family transcriptional regulator [Rhizobium sp. SG741]NKJ08407.1 DNA-binding transcriptional MerR regulator [Rhizobium sp. SG741]
MLISAFAAATGLSRDTIRFYIRLGLIEPQKRSGGARHPYQIFSARDVTAAKMIRTAQSLGLSLKEISAIAKERREGRMTQSRSADILRGQVNLLEKKAIELSAMTDYLYDKIRWIEGGELGAMADFEQYLAHARQRRPK